MRNKLSTQTQRTERSVRHSDIGSNERLVQTARLLLFRINVLIIDISRMNHIRLICVSNSPEILYKMFVL